MSSPLTTRFTSTPRLPSDTHIGKVRFRVADLERAVTFYRDVLGLQITQDTKKKLSLAPASTGDELIVLEERQGIAPRPRRPRTAGLYHVALLVPSRRDLGRT